MTEPRLIRAEDLIATGKPESIVGKTGDEIIDERDMPVGCREIVGERFQVQKPIGRFIMGEALKEYSAGLAPVIVGESPCQVRLLGVGGLGGHIATNRAVHLETGSIRFDKEPGREIGEWLVYCQWRSNGGENLATTRGSATARHANHSGAALAAAACLQAERRAAHACACGS